jgi:hypothetical protein
MAKQIPAMSSVAAESLKHLPQVRSATAEPTTTSCGTAQSIGLPR